MRGLTLLVVLCCLAGFTSPAQADLAHPKVGLVLSGGGARGLAHIGVIKALEEERIPIDAIAGTSMGAVIGGLYASGYRPEEIEKLAQTLDWGNLLSDSPPRKDIPFRRKQDDRAFLIKRGLSFRTDGSVGLPRGAIQGQNLALVLEKLLVRSTDTQDFDRLPIPFRAVAADIVNDRKVVFSKGHLPQALLASTAIPGVFAPVEVDGRLLVDGGMVDSLPVDVAREMGVDVVIAVDIGTPLRNKEQMRNLLDVLNQSVTIISRRNSDAQIATLRSSDILLTPPLENYGFADFGQAKQIIDAGYRAARAARPRLLALQRPEARRHAAALASSEGPQAPIINRIKVVNNSSVSDAVVRDKIRQETGRPLDLEQLQKDMGTLYGLDYFEQVQYRVEHEPAGNTLVIDARQKRSGIDYLRLGLSLSDDFKGEGVYNIGASFRKNGINRLGAEWLTRLQLGDEQEFFTEFYQPLDVGSRWFIAPNLAAEARNIDNTLENDPISRYRLERYGYGLNLGRQIANNGELRFGVGQAWGHNRLRIGDRGLPEEHFNEGFYEIRYSFDTEDNVDYPLSGERIGLSLRQFEPQLGSDQRYRQWTLNLEKPLAYGENTFLIGGRYARTSGEADLVSSSMLLGGAQQLSGFRKDALSGQNLGLARVIYYRRINPRSFLPVDYPLYFGASLEHGRIWNNDNEFNSGGINAGSLFLGYLTPIGPLNFTFGINDEHEQALYLNLGQSF